MLLTPKLSRPATTVDQLALQDFARATRQAFWRSWLSWLTGKSNKLLLFEQVRQHLGFRGQHYRGLDAVPLDRIVGSVNRPLDFDRAFFPRQIRTRDRWLRIDQAYYHNIALPPVELLKVGELYFVSDRHHRVSVARVWGQEFIDAAVTEIDTSASVFPYDSLEFSVVNFDASDYRKLTVPQRSFNGGTLFGARAATLLVRLIAIVEPSSPKSTGR